MLLNGLAVAICHNYGDALAQNHLRVHTHTHAHTLGLILVYLLILLSNEIV